MVTPSVQFLAFNLTEGTGRLFADLDRTVPQGRPMHALVPLLVEIAERKPRSFGPCSGLPTRRWN